MSTFTKGAAAEVQSTPRDPTDPAVRAVLAAKPQAAFPTGVAVVRVQESGYRTRTAAGYGGGKYCVVTTRDVEKDEHFDRLSRLPQISGVAPLNRLLLAQPVPVGPGASPGGRGAAGGCAAGLHARHHLPHRRERRSAHGHLAGAGARTRPRRVITTASAVLLDTRSGYVYGVAESTEKSSQLTSSLDQRGERSTNPASARKRRRFDKLVAELEKTWPRVVSQYAGGTQTERCTRRRRSEREPPSPSGRKKERRLTRRIGCFTM
jgi:hypothetical protein